MEARRARGGRANVFAQGAPGPDQQDAPGPGLGVPPHPEGNRRHQPPRPVRLPREAGRLADDKEHPQRETQGRCPTGKTRLLRDGSDRGQGARPVRAPRDEGGLVLALAGRRAHRVRCRRQHPGEDPQGGRPQAARVAQLSGAQDGRQGVRDRGGSRSRVLPRRAHALQEAAHQAKAGSPRVPRGEVQPGLPAQLLPPLASTPGRL